MLKVSLDDKYVFERGKILVNGTQLLVKLPLLQKKIDELNGLNTAGFISGYRGSPLGAYDKALWQAKDYLKSNSINFSPGLNEDLAATAVWGTQQPDLLSKSKKDGVFSIWYGKGPGVDRSGDAFKHSNSAGTSKYGGVLVLLGDDHTAKSSTLAHQSEFAMLDAQIPILNPSNLKDLLEYSIFGWALSRYSGLWVSIKCITSNIDSTASIDLDIAKLNYSLPYKTNVSIRWPDTVLEQEDRISSLKIPLALEFANNWNINLPIWNQGKKKLGVIATGKAYADTLECFSRLGITKKKAEEIGLHLFKVGMTWPLDKRAIGNFSKNFKELFIIEEKRDFLEKEIKYLLYNSEGMPKIICGKNDENNNKLLSKNYELSKLEIENALISRINKACDINLSSSYQLYNNKANLTKGNIERTPYFCSGCPHNTSTKIPEDSKAMAGIGCHYMSLWMDRNTSLFTHMGGEGANWIGMSPFVEEEHIFQNIGDGTYNHSGFLAIRAAVAAKVNITYKILYNDAVAMTGGQPVDGIPTPESISHQLFGEGVNKIAIVTDDLTKYRKKLNLPKIASLHERKELDIIQKDFRKLKGVTVIIYDQMCATEKRRKRKRGLLDEPLEKVFINSLVCEGCGDCSKKSNCISIEPYETEFGRKRKVNQSNCNKDYSCIDGFCPSFITVEGASVKKQLGLNKAPPTEILRKLRIPKKIEIEKPYNILVAGIGGTGVVTIGALISMAAHIENNGVTVLDQVGIAQKGGAVLSHIRIASKQVNIFSAQIPNQSTNILLGCDMVVSSSNDVKSLINSSYTNSIINDNITPVAQSVLNPDFTYDTSLTQKIIKNTTNSANFLNASEISNKLFGNTIFGNIFLVGYGVQKGLIPVSKESFEEAIRLNKSNIIDNINAFNWGRVAANNVNAFFDILGMKGIKKLSIEEKIDQKYQDLIKYKNIQYANKFLNAINAIKNVEIKLKCTKFRITLIAIDSLYKVMAYKDEYEVARLYTDGRFQSYLNENFNGDYKVKYYLSPPFLGLKDKKTGQPRKIKLGHQMKYIFKLLARIKFLRNTIMDPFSYTKERKEERKLVELYFSTIEKITYHINKNNYNEACELLETFNSVKGYGHVKHKNLEAFKSVYEEKFSSFNKVSSLLKPSAAAE